MEYDGLKKQAIKDEFKSRRMRQIAVAIPLVLIMLAMIILPKTDFINTLDLSMDILGPIFFIVILATVIFSFINWRCPGCKKYLGKTISPKFCTKCGVELR